MKRGIATVGFVLLAAANLAAAEDAETRKQIEQLQHEQQRMQQEIDRLNKQLQAPTPAPAESKRVDEIERRQGIITDEVRNLREALVLPETKELKSYYGLGPAASKVYSLERGLSIGGYGETNFKGIVSNKGSDTNEFDLVRFVVYVGYKFNDWIVMNSETEVEHTTTGEGSENKGEVSVEFATLDFLLHPKANVRAGLMLVPMGFINEMHEPPFFFGNERPPVETVLLPSTWSANGIGLFGELLPGLTYRTYGITSLDAINYESSGIREARQNGSLERAQDFSWVGRADYTLLPGSSVGGSLYLGNQGQGRAYGDSTIGTKTVGVFTQIYEGHVQVRTRGVEFRALATGTFIDNVTRLSLDPSINQPIADRLYGYYAEIGYDLLPLLVPETTQYLAPWFRYSHTNTQVHVAPGLAQDNTQNRDYFEVGLQYKPIPQVVLKLDYRNLSAQTGTLPDEIRVGGGFVF